MIFLFCLFVFVSNNELSAKLTTKQKKLILIFTGIIMFDFFLIKKINQKEIKPSLETISTQLIAIELGFCETFNRSYLEKKQKSEIEEIKNIFLKELKTAQGLSVYKIVGLREFNARFTVTGNEYIAREKILEKMQSEDENIEQKAPDTTRSPARLLKAETPQKAELYLELKQQLQKYLANISKKQEERKKFEEIKKSTLSSKSQSAINSTFGSKNPSAATSQISSLTTSPVPKLKFNKIFYPENSAPNTACSPERKLTFEDQIEAPRKTTLEVPNSSTSSIIA